MLKAYYHLTKPGIIYGNAMTAVAGFLLALNQKTSFASRHSFVINVELFFCMIVGLSLVIGSGCVLNNIYDAKIDAKMPRTKNREMAEGVIKKPQAIVYGFILLLLGLIALHFTTLLALWVAIFGWVVYVVFYTPLKHKTSFATIIGSFAGAVPPVVGYTSFTGKLDFAALLLFLILIFWQMPHFYSIAIRRLEDYKAAAIPILPLQKGIHRTKITILAYILIFAIACSFLTYYGYTGFIYLAIMLALSIWWLWQGLKGFRQTDSVYWAKKMFLTSLIILTVFSILISFGKYLA